MNHPYGTYELVAQRALDWVAGHRDDFRLPPLSAPNFTKLLKPLGELALTAGVVRRASRDNWPRGTRLAEELLQLCWEELGHGSHLLEVIRSEPSLLALAAIYQPLREAGLRHEPFELALPRLVSMRGVNRLEYPPWRQLELGTSLRAMGLDTPWDVVAAYRQTWLAARAEPWMLCTDSAYSLTHTVFYCTDFGRYPQRIPAPDRRYLVRWLPVWFEYFTRANDYDIAAELVIVARCIAAADSGPWAERLHEHQRENGMIPGPPVRGGAPRPAIAASGRSEFIENYHTTLVGLMAAALSCSPSGANPAPGHTIGDEALASWRDSVEHGTGQRTGATRQEETCH